jgi:hypothetical protein
MAKKFYTLDAETDPFEYGAEIKPFIWGVFDGVKFQHFNNTADLINFIEKENAIFYAHNGGKFDFHFLAEYLNRDEQILMINSRLVKAKIGQCEVRDSYALLPFPLAAYKKDDFDYNKLKKENREKYMGEIIDYLCGDCVYLYELLEEFFSEYGRHLTAPGAALKTLCKLEDLQIPNPGKFFSGEFRKHYFGGRCEVLSPGSFFEDLNYYDINSAYPYAMLHQHPIGCEYEYYHYEQPPIIPHAFYTIEARSWGAFSERTKTGLKFDWSGEPKIFHTTGHELKAAIETNSCEILEHIEQKIFKNTINFEKFINYFWDLRQNYAKNTPQNLFAKLMMNSAYGKFAANPEKYETFVLYDPAISEYLVENEWDIRGELGGSIIASKPLEEDEQRHYNIATGASITGFVRAMLLRAIKSVERPIYCDTDSLVFTGSHSLDIHDDLGGWSSEGEFMEGHFAGKKLYALKHTNGKTKISSKGSRLDFTQIKKITEGEEIQYKQPAPVFSWYKENSYLTRTIKRTA